MRFDSTGTAFQCHCQDSDFNEDVVMAAVEWCANNAADWNYAVKSATEYTIKDFGDGLEPVGGLYWSVRIWFVSDDDAVAFKLALDGIGAEAAC